MEWYTAFALTLAIELPVVGLLCPPGARRRGVKDAAAANLLTHPCAWWAILSAGPLSSPKIEAPFASECSSSRRCPRKSGSVFPHPSS